MFSAAVGASVTLNGETIHVRPQSDPAPFVIGTALLLDPYVHSKEAYDRLHQIREQVAAARLLGSCALSLANVACGRLDGYFEAPTGFCTAPRVW